MDLKNSKDLPIGGYITKPGNSLEFKTGVWRTYKPVFHSEKCVNCGLCTLYCPDDAIIRDENNKVVGINYEYCKGCGICSNVCKVKAITMELEQK
ncbi:MAG: pyruvate synthase subunit PorD [Candidatus Woesearchaeota archaeon]